MRRLLSWVFSCGSEAAEAQAEAEAEAPEAPRIVSKRAVKHGYVNPRLQQGRCDLSGGTSLPMADLPYSHKEWRDFKGSPGSPEVDLERRLALRLAGS